MTSFEVHALKRTGIYRSPVDTLSFKNWCLFLAFLVLRTRSFFPASIMPLASATERCDFVIAGFPLPVPFVECSQGCLQVFHLPKGIVAISDGLCTLW